MNQDKKTSSFLKAINKYAKEQSDAILQEVEEFKKQEIEKATKEALLDAYNLIQKTITTEKAKIVSEYAKKEQESKKELYIKRNEIVENVFKLSEEKLVEFTKSEKYDEYLINCAKEIFAVFENRPCVVYLKSADESKKELIAPVLKNATFEISDSITLGGIKAYCEEQSILADNTLDSKLLAQREWFCENSGLKVV